MTFIPFLPLFKNIIFLLIYLERILLLK